MAKRAARDPDLAASRHEWLAAAAKRSHRTGEAADVVVEAVERAEMHVARAGRRRRGMSASMSKRPNAELVRAPELALGASGRVTIPKPIRDYLGLAPGDRIRFRLQRDGESVAVKIVKAGRSAAEIKLRERASRGDVRKALAILERAGVGNPPMKGDELPRKKRG